MRKPVPPLSSIAAVIAAAALSLSTLSVAQADQQTDKAPAATVAAKKHTARTHHQKQRESARAPKLYGAATSARCAWPYRNMFPPCMSTWSGDDPNFYGSTHPGVTFDQPWEPWWK